jgi:hypothetical protein
MHEQQKSKLNKFKNTVKTGFKKITDIFKKSNPSGYTQFSN